jgi:hypothetical protein
MSANVAIPPTDGGFSTGLPGDRVIRGTLVRWTHVKGWTDRDGLPLPPTVLVTDYATALRRWQSKRAEYITEHPLPDPEVLNAAIPITEWEIGLDGKPREPWKVVYRVYMVNLKTGKIYTFINSTYGALLAYNDLVEQIGVYRMLCGEHVFPIVELSSGQWKSQQYGLVPRPDFKIVEWRKPGGSLPVPPQTPAPQLPGPVTAAIPQTPATQPTAPAAAAAAAPAAAAPATSTKSPILDATKPAAKPMTVAEMIADEIPWK